MNHGRQEHTTLVFADGRVLDIGGSNRATVLRSVELYDPSTETWMVTGGQDGNPLNSVELYDATTVIWTIVTNMADA